MGPKLLFFVGIVAAHGAVGAAWMHEEAPPPRASATACVNSPVPLPYFHQQAELLAMLVVPILDEDAMQP
jgi:hypothetical protein